ncbi:hypothetical protein OG783_09070 [Streptomyces jietaisiensis]|uniref:hypothetical protein n=1 Tax=Streptomyces griseoaurantiacus TaxID=68213 RepID=UPI0032458BBC
MGDPDPVDADLLASLFGEVGGDLLPHGPRLAGIEAELLGLGGQSRGGEGVAGLVRLTARRAGLGGRGQSGGARHQSGGGHQRYGGTA